MHDYQMPFGSIHRNESMGIGAVLAFISLSMANTKLRHVKPQKRYVQRLPLFG